MAQRPWRLDPARARRALRIGDVADSRDNNLNLIRMVAAAGVLVSHAYPIALGTGTTEPLRQTLGAALGTLCVYVFFAISGFLILRSWERARSPLEWMTARGLRIFPGLLAAATLCAFALGPIATTLPLDAYLGDVRTLTYVPRNVTLVWLQYPLPGVFVDNPYPEVVNGSLWTLFYEMACYGLVFAVGLTGLTRTPRSRAATFLGYLAFYVAVALWREMDDPHYRLWRFAELSAPFVIGMAFYVWRDSIVLSGWLAVAGAAALALVAWADPHPAILRATLFVTLTYGVFALAYLPGGALRRYNVLGDYSYGVYIYAFPAQQTAVAFFGADQVWSNIAVSAPITLALAVLSWTLVEKPALGARKTVVALLSRGLPTPAQPPR